MLEHVSELYSSWLNVSPSCGCPTHCVCASVNLDYCPRFRVDMYLVMLLHFLVDIKNVNIYRVLCCFMLCHVVSCSNLSKHLWTYIFVLGFVGNTRALETLVGKKGS